MKKLGSLSLISAITFFIIGLILFTNPDAVVKFISYCIGGILILIGCYKVANYYIQDKRLGVVNNNEMAFGITAIILGVVFIFLASAIELLLRFIVGGYLLLIGLNKIASTFYTTDRSNKFYALIIVGLIFIAAGLYIIIVSNLALSIIGLFMMIYGVIDFVSYFVYKDKKEEVKKDEPFIIEENDVIETEVVEEKETKKSRKRKK